MNKSDNRIEYITLASVVSAIAVMFTQDNTLVIYIYINLNFHFYQQSF